MHGGYNFRDRNERKNTILEFAIVYNLVLAKTCFKKDA